MAVYNMALSSVLAGVLESLPQLLHTVNYHWLIGWRFLVAHPFLGNEG